MTPRPTSADRASGFTLIEALMTVAILGIMAAVLVSAFSNTSTDTNRMVARQQQAAIQAALNSWVNGESNRANVINATTGTAKLRTIEEIRAAYNAVVTSSARLALISSYLDSTTYDHFYQNTTNTGKIKSLALTAAKQYISLPDWAVNDYPKALLNAE